MANNAQQEALRILSKDGALTRTPNDLSGISAHLYQATWDAYERGFIAGATWQQGQSSFFYRICKPESSEGLWYAPDGTPTGTIHKEFGFCSASALAMPYDEELVGWLSACPTLEQFFQWFPARDVLRLQEHGYFIHVYEAVDTKFYEPFQHVVISQTTSRIVHRLVLANPI